MIDINNILNWKEQFGEIYQIEVRDRHFIFRPIGREEYKQIILMDLELGEFQEMICFQSIIYPDDYDYSTGIAGIAEVMSDVVLDASGLHMGQAKELLDEFREEMFNYDYQVDCMIHEAFPEYKIEEISEWSVRKTMYYLSRAEWILQTLKGVPLQYIDEEVQQEAMQQQQMQEQQIQEQPEQSTNNPYQREIRKELVQHVEQEPKPKADMSQKDNSELAQTEAEVLAMLSGAGAKVSEPISDIDAEVKPELSWFGYMDELKGEFD